MPVAPPVMTATLPSSNPAILQFLLLRIERIPDLDTLLCTRRVQSGASAPSINLDVRLGVMGVNYPTSHLSGPQPLQSVVDPFDRLVVDGNRLDLPGTHEPDQLTKILGRTYVRAAHDQLTLCEKKEGRLQEPAEEPDIDVGSAGSEYRQGQTRRLL